MRPFVPLLLLATLATSTAPASTPAPSGIDDLAALDDEFERRDGLGGWTLFHSAYGWPDKLRSLDVGNRTPGALQLQPQHSAWVRDLVAPFLFKPVQGDFDVRARVRVRGEQDAVPGGTWSLGGLMARVPNRNSAQAWQPRRENWHFITTGVGHVPRVVMTETKGTYNSYSSLKLRPWQSGWTELRLVRVGMTLFALARPDASAPWQLRDRFYRMEGNPEMQVGLIAYTTSPDMPEEREDPEVINRRVDAQARTDMLLEVDWVHFRRPRASADRDWYAQVSAHPLADPNLSEAAILAALGD